MKRVELAVKAPTTENVHPFAPHVFPVANTCDPHLIPRPPPVALSAGTVMLSPELACKTNSIFALVPATENLIPPVIASIVLTNFIGALAVSDFTISRFMICFFASNLKESPLHSKYLLCPAQIVTHTRHAITPS
jgi:hypothetical protein